MWQNESKVSLAPLNWFDKTDASASLERGDEAVKNLLGSVRSIAPQPQLNLQRDVTKRRAPAPVHRMQIKFATFARIIRTPAALGNLNLNYP